MSGPRCAQHPCSSRYPGCLPPTWGTATVDTGKTHLKHQLSWDTFSWRAPCSLRLATYSRVRGWDLTRTCEMGSRPRHPCSPGPRNHRAVPSAASSFPTYKTGTRPTRDLTHWGCLCTLREHLGNILLAHATACPPRPRPHMHPRPKQGLQLQRFHLRVPDRHPPWTAGPSRMAACSGSAHVLHWFSGQGPCLCHSSVYLLPNAWHTARD